MSGTTKGNIPTLEELKIGLERGEIKYHVQPIFNINNGLVIGVEALMRWQRSPHELLIPEYFLDVLTAHYSPTLAPPIQAANKVARMFTSLYPNMFCAFNISGALFDKTQSIYTAWIKDLMNSVPATQIVFEIVETDTIKNLEQAQRVAHDLRKSGMRIALDDFGTGLSNLDRLRDFSVDIVKIDRRFITSLDDNPRSFDIIRGLMQITTSLGVEVIAEGIEKTEQLNMLRDLGITLGQGYSLGKPADAQFWYTRLQDYPYFELS